jgi:Na+-translocating ferredoxin:NAD+ oxidoreductase RnfG subunit
MVRLGIITIFLFLVSLHASVLITPQDAMRQTFGTDVSVEKKNILLTRQQASAVSQTAKTELKTKIYRSFKAMKDGNIIGYGVLISGKVRSKNAAVLYLIEPAGRLKAIEVVAFNEPPEFLPSKNWLKLFEGRSSAEPLRVGKDVPTITGATMSARNVTDGARVALAVFQHAIKVDP